MRDNVNGETLEGPMYRHEAWARCVHYAGLLRDKGLTRSFGVEIRPHNGNGTGAWSVVLVRYPDAEVDAAATFAELVRNA